MKSVVALRWFLICVFLLLPGFAYAANSSTAGSIRVQPGSATNVVDAATMDVTATYVGDDNGNNRVRVEWGLEGVDFSLGNNLSAAHPAVPYSYTINGLDNAEIYQVRVSIEDSDGGTASKTFNNLRPFNRILHNAVTTGSSKQSGNWGLSGGLYGEFTCDTCHDPTSNNIKRIRSNWGALSNGVPADSNNVTVVFDEAIDGADNYALNDTSGHSSSNRICEACHTATNYHTYNSGAQADHNSTKDCMTCHPHKTAFAPPGCSSCHGGGMFGAVEDNFWPDSGVENVDNPGSENDSGEHAVHMAVLALADGYANLQALLDSPSSKADQISMCERCHGANAGSAAYHYGGDDVGDIGTMTDIDGSADSLTPAGSESSLTCSNIDCHNNNNSASPAWYAGATASCDMCHNSSNPNPVKLNPTSGLHYSAAPNGVELHDDSFTGGGTCLTCHGTSPSDKHGDGTIDTPATANFSFNSDATVDIKLYNKGNYSSSTYEGMYTCAATCHFDNKNWYRIWTSDAFDPTPFDTSSSGAITTTINADLPPSCNGCHGEFINGWAEGTAHYNMDQDNVSSGASHNSQNPNINPGAACVDCHLYPDHVTPGQGLARHENGKITLTDDQDGPDSYTPYEDNEGTRTGVYCSDCHEASVSPRDGFDANTFELSSAFPGGFGAGNGIEIVPTDRNPEYTCFSGANGCHGDQSNNWWPNLDSTNPADYPNREGAHYEHGTTIGELLAEQANLAFPGSRTDSDGDGRVDAIQEDRNKTCNFCHPMQWNATRGVWESLYHRANTPEVGAVVTDVFGGWNFSGADKAGIYTSGTPSNYPAEWFDIDTDGTTGFAYQLEEDPLDPGKGTYPLDHDGEYWQYIDAYKNDNTVRNGVCSNVHCHSNSPFTPSWYGDHQAPGQITDLAAETHNQDASGFPALVLHSDHNTYEWDEPGSVRLYWTAPGNNGHFSGVADQYGVFYRKATDGPITDDNLPSCYYPDGTIRPAGSSYDNLTFRAGNAATVLRQGEVQEMMVEGLTPGVSYNFAVVTRDAPHYKDLVNVGDGVYETLVSQANYSTVSNNATATAHSDDVIPVFYGVDKLKPHDVEKVVNMSWDSAKDHTMPISYRVWYTTYSLKAHLSNGGQLYDDTTDPTGSNLIECFTPGSPPTPVGDTPSDGDYCIETDITEAIHYQIVVPTAGDLYSFLVRATDGNGNYDDNTNVQMVLPKAAPAEATETKMYIYNGTNMVEQADVGNPTFPGAGTIVVAGTDVILQTNTTTTRESLVSGISFDAELNWGSRAILQMSAEFGYWDGAFVRLGTMDNTQVQDSSIYLTRRVTRLAKFSFANYRGIVPANKTLAIRFKRYDSNTGTDLDLNYGTVTTKGQLLANIQPYNKEPSSVTVTPQLRAGGYIDVDWTTASAGTGDTGQTVHYDVFGSADNGATYPYVIGTDLVDADDLNGAEYGRVTWDTVGDGLTSSYNCMVKVEVGDGYEYEDPSAPNYPDPFEDKQLGPTVWSTHNASLSGTVAVDNISDVEPPASVTIHSAETRPKQGSVYLTWTAVGDDGLNHGTRVSYYDIRYKEDPIGTGVLTDGNWDAAVQANGEPVPGFSGSLESYDLLGLAPEFEYDIGIKACDEADNCSTIGALSTTEGWRINEGLADPVHGGPFYCGICHSTPPDEPDTKGIHREHGYTLEDCAKCHGDGTNPSGNDVTQYDGRHYNGYIDIGWAKDDVGGNQAALVQIPIENGGSNDVTIAQTTLNNGAVTIYQDLTDGPGGYNMPAGQTATATTYTDSGTCMNFGSANANGCHGPFEPQWAPSNAVPNPPTPACADCHGDPSLVVNDDAGTGMGRLTDPYGRQWDCIDESLPQIEDPPSSGDFYYQPSELVKASPPLDNHGQSAKTEKYTGAHLRHLNSSFRFAKGDSCRLCHLDTMYSGEHADGKVDIRFDTGADQAGYIDPAEGIFLSGDPDVGGMSCGKLSTDSCHDTFDSGGAPLSTDQWPVWNTPGAQCDSCHGMSTMGTVPHITDGVARACDWCHLAGHPQSPDGINSGDPDALLVNNNPAVGIDYKSGGIHMRKVINGRSTLNSGEAVDTLAEMCWACHEDNSVSEWGGDDLPTNTSVEPYSGVGSIYNYGSLNITSWYAVTTEGSEVGATWSSAETNFGYKDGRIQSTHSTDPEGVSDVTWSAANGRYDETLDPVSKIRCTNCHDVHDLNKADGDTVSGAPYLRGTWKSNPYEEDGAPWAKTYAVPGTPTPSFGPVPRGGTTYSEKGGYYIDQNNVRPGTATAATYPTSGWTVASSAGLCVLCHDADVDNMDKKSGEGLWLGANGHSNSALGGTFTNGANIFDYTHGRPTPWNSIANLGSIDYATVPDMAIQSHLADMLDNSESYAYVHRSAKEGWLDPNIGANYAYNSFNWGVSIDAGTTDVMYHQFSCSKCHNPHASRLPKLMITNCLDLRHNTWDDQAANSLQNTFTSSTLDRVDRNMGTGYYATAQNCHRFDAARGDEDNNNTYEDRDKRGGWNKVTPWVKDNLSNAEHKGSRDPAYGTSNSTSPWRHSDFPTESTGW